jgi:hypothetical protein
VGERGGGGASQPDPGQVARRTSAPRIRRRCPAQTHTCSRSGRPVDPAGVAGRPGAWLRPDGLVPLAGSVGLFATPSRPWWLAPCRSSSPISAAGLPRRQPARRPDRTTPGAPACCRRRSARWRRPLTGRWRRPLTGSWPWRPGWSGRPTSARTARLPAGSSSTCGLAGTRLHAGPHRTGRAATSAACDSCQGPEGSRQLAIPTGVYARPGNTSLTVLAPQRLSRISPSRLR